MIQLPDEQPHADVLAKLRAWQEKIDGIPDYATRVSEADARFNERRSKKGTMTRVFETLKSMAGSAERCSYCEDSKGSSIDHVRPRSLYPEDVFVWENMILACSACNGAKLDHHAILLDGVRHDCARRRGDPVVPPPRGPMLLINPRLEDPLHFMTLDLEYTFFFVVRDDVTALDELRFEYTRDTLRLNDSPLPEQRLDAYWAFRDLLGAYIYNRERGKSAEHLASHRPRLRHRSHQTVWREILRHMREGDRKVVQDFGELFEQVPEALGW